DLAGAAALEARGDEHRVDLAAGGVRTQVADVRDVLDMEDLDAVVEHGPPDEVSEEERPKVPDVGVAVHRRAARVHPKPTGLERLDGDHRSRQRVPEPERHG